MIPKAQGNEINMKSQRNLKHMVFLIGWTICVLSISSIGLAKEPLKVSFMVSSGKQRTVFVKLVRQFQNQHRDLDVIHKEMEQETYKIAIEEWLNTKNFHSDVFLWFSGEKLKDFVSKGWVEPIDDLWRNQKWDNEFTKASKTAVSVQEKIYGLPMSYYQWGFYYRKSTFQQLDLQPPQTWREFLKVGERLKANNIIPILLGSKYRWTAAGWFDYLNLRINGLPFHQNLMAGKVSYTDRRVLEVFRYWKELLDRQFFLKTHKQYDWRSSLPYLYRGKTGMLLMGNFLAPQLPESIRDDIGFFRFPQIKPDMPYYEEAPLDVLIIPHNAKNKKGAKQFLAFMGRAETQHEMNSQTGMISPNRVAQKKGQNRLIQAGAKILEEAEGISQFYDRDTPQKMFDAGMDAIIQFMEQPNKIAEILEELEKVRKQLFK